MTHQPYAEPDPKDAAWFRRWLIDHMDSSWDNNFLEHLLHPEAAEMRRMDYDAETTIDAISHRLTAAVFEVYDDHGFTAHQGHLIHTDPNAYNNLWGDDRTYESVNALLALDIPRAHLVNIFRVAHTPEETDTWAAKWRQGTADVREVEEANLTMQAALINPPDPIPGCCLGAETATSG